MPRMLVTLITILLWTVWPVLSWDTRKSALQALTNYGGRQCRLKAQFPTHRPEDFCPIPAYGDEPIWGPFAYSPFCANTTFCVFTNQWFHGGGISIILNAESKAKTVATFANAFTTPLIEPARGSEGPPYDVRDLPRKGKGAIASRKILRGEAFMVDYATLLLEVDLRRRVGREAADRLVEWATAQLPSPETVISLARMGKESHVVWDIIRTNSFNGVVGGVEFAAIFPELSVSNQALSFG